LWIRLQSKSLNYWKNGPKQRRLKVLSQHEYEEREAADERRELMRETRERHDTWVTFWCEYQASPDFVVKRLVAGTSHDHAAKRFVLICIRENDITPEDGDGWQVIVEGERYTVTMQLTAERTSAIQAGTRTGDVGRQETEEGDARCSTETSPT
jgi:hypothetical protein